MQLLSPVCNDAFLNIFMQEIYFLFLMFMLLFSQVFTTHNGREVAGFVEEHCDGVVRVNLLNSDESIMKREEDVRLTESRYCLYYITFCCTGEVIPGTKTWVV